MKLNELKPAIGSKKTSKRVGRGIGSGKGKTAAKGHKGQRARAGVSITRILEGGQNPLLRRLPKRGFNPLNKLYYDVVNFVSIMRLVESKNIDTSVTFTKEFLFQQGLISLKKKVKLLAKGELNFPLKIEVDAISAAAEDQVKSAGGEVIIHKKS